jgi:hypothetical protein
MALLQLVLTWLSKSSEVSSGILIHENYKKKKNQKEQDICWKTLAAPKKKIYIYAENKKTLR